MEWLIKDDKGAWQLGPNLNYSLKNTWEAANPDFSQEQVDGLLAIPSKDLPFWLESGNRLILSMQVEWKFINLKPAFADAVGRPS